MPVMTLDDRIYCLQKTDLPEDLSEKLRQADIAYLQDRIYFSTLLVYEIIESCIERKIQLYTPANFVLA